MATTREFWEERELKREKELTDRADGTMVQLKTMFGNATREIKKEVSSFYSEYGEQEESPTFGTTNNGTPVIEGTSSKLVVPIGVATAYNRLDKLQNSISSILTGNARRQQAYMNSALSQLAQESYNTQMFNHFQAYNVGFGFDVLSPNVVNQIITNPVHGSSFSARIWNNRALLANQVNEELRTGIQQGLSTREMAQRLANKMNVGLDVAMRLMRTEITNTYNQASLAAYEELGISKYQYQAFLDNRTSEICIALDGEVFKVRDAVAGLNYPPMHPNCRSSTIAYLPDSQFMRRARDPETGDTYEVPSTMNYSEWAEIYL